MKVKLKKNHREWVDYTINPKACTERKLIDGKEGDTYVVPEDVGKRWTEGGKDRIADKVGAEEAPSEENPVANGQDLGQQSSREPIRPVSSEAPSAASE